MVATLEVSFYRGFTISALRCTRTNNLLGYIYYETFSGDAVHTYTYSSTTEVKKQIDDFWSVQL